MPRNAAVLTHGQPLVRERLVHVGLALHRFRSVDQATRRWARLMDDLGWVADRLAAIRKSGADLCEDIEPVIGWIEQALDARMFKAPGGDVLQRQALAILAEIRQAR